MIDTGSSILGKGTLHEILKRIPSLVLITFHVHYLKTPKLNLIHSAGVACSLWNHMTHRVISKVRKLLPTH